MSKTMIRKIKDVLRNVKFLQRPYSKIKVSLIERRRFKGLHTYGYSVLNEVVETLRLNNIKAFCAFGTLLGFVRDGGFISTDDDIDMGLLPDPEFSWDKLENAMGMCGMRKTRQFQLGNIVTEQSYEKKGVQVDFFMYRVETGRMVANVYWINDNKKYKNEKGHSVMYRYCPNINELTVKTIHSFNVPIPSNYEEYLKETYGNWRTPDPNFKHEDVVETREDLEAIRIDF